MAASTNVERIRQYYNNDVQREWDRHERLREKIPWERFSQSAEEKYGSGKHVK